MKSQFVLTVFLSLSLAVTSEYSRLRLPESVWPVDYDLHIEPDHSNDRFSGRVTITVVANEETSEIKLNSEYLSINSVSVSDQNGKSLQVKSFYLQKIIHHYMSLFLIIKLAENNNLKPNQQYLLAISFNKSFEDTSYFKESYQIDNRISYYSATLFKPENLNPMARQVFPCFDEPQFKATFRLSLTHERNLVALSNMPEESSQELAGNKKTTTFVRSPIKIPTHLFGWAVGEFKSIEQTTNNGLKIRSFSRPDQTERTRFLLSTVVKLVEFYESLLEIPYPLPKLDLLTLPIFSHNSPGIESIGLHGVTGSFDFDSKLTPADQIKHIVQTIGSAIAKDWFGNLLTMSSLYEAALIDGITDYLFLKALSSGLKIDNVKWPNNFKYHFVIDQLHSAIETDSKNKSYPISISPKRGYFPQFVNEFKASSILQMIEDLIGQQVLMSAVKNYLAKYKDSSAGVKELLYEIDAVFDKSMFGGKINNITDCMSKWFYDKNLPVVSVSRSANGLSVQQHRFSVDGGSEQSDWIIPIKIITRSGATTTFILNKPSDGINIQISDNDWFKLNAGSVGYYLVNYQLEDWLRLTTVLSNSPSVLSPADRANLIFDAFQLADANRLNYSVAFNLLSFLANDDHLLPWQTAYKELASLMETTNNQEKECLQQLSLQLSAKLYQQLGWNDALLIEEPINKRLFRIKILDLSCRSGSTDCLDSASERLSKLMQNNNTVGPDNRLAVYKYGVEQRGEQIDKSVFQWLLNRNATESWVVERDYLLNGLSMIRSPKLLSELIRLIVIGNSPMTYNDLNYVRTKIINHNPIGRSVVWSFFRDNWDRIPEKNIRLGYLMELTIVGLDREEQLNEVAEFLKRHPNEIKKPEKYYKKIRKYIQRRLTGAGADETVCLNWQQGVEVTRTKEATRLREDKPATIVKKDDPENDSAFDAFDLFDD